MTPMLTSLCLSVLANLGAHPVSQVKAAPPQDTTDATAEGIEILRRILVDALAQSASDRTKPQTTFQTRLFGRLHENELVTQLWSGDGTVSHSRGFHLPGEGVFFCLDVGIPLVEGSEPPPAAEEEAERDDEWERTREKVRKGTTGDGIYTGVWKSDVLEPQRRNLELDPEAIREIEDVTLRTLARHASRIEGLSPNNTITVAFHLSGSGSMPMFVAPDDEERDVKWLTLDSFQGVEKRLVIRVALSDLTGLGVDGTGIDRVRQRARVYEY